MRTDLSAYELIVPCGMADVPVASLGTLLGDAAPTLEEVRDVLADVFAAVFGLKLEPVTARDLGLSGLG
ncbi:MAG: hypothetical protein JRI55_25830 [Deltaproteobacteria bacterium]|nr:hypothetical protein [Deltaproteobacteria bacterium]